MPTKSHSELGVSERILRLVEPLGATEGRQLSDATLLEEARKREPWAVALLYERCAPRMERMLLRTIGPDSELPDLLHDAFLRLVDSLSALREPGALMAWATRVATRTALDALRRRRRRRWLRLGTPEELVGVDEGSIFNPEERDALRRVQHALNVLPAEERVAFALRVIEGIPLAEVAAACGCSLATVKRRLARGEARFLAVVERDPVLRHWIRAGDRWGGES